MNLIWAVMILIGILYGTVTGNAAQVSDAVLNSAKEAVALCITMLGVTAVWSGLMEIAKEAGLVEAAAKLLRPFIRFLFPKIPEGHPAAEYITMNCAANLLGLGWAATPAGLKAMKALETLEDERRESHNSKSQAKVQSHDSKSQTYDQSHQYFVEKGVASDEMCTFLILNISSLQLIPVNLIAYRAQYGSVNPFAIILPGIFATAVSTGAAVIYCKVTQKKNFLKKF